MPACQPPRNNPLLGTERKSIRIEEEMGYRNNCKNLCALVLLGGFIFFAFTYEGRKLHRTESLKELRQFV